MRIALCDITERRSRRATPAAELAADYLSRLAAYAECEVHNFTAEAKLLDFAAAFGAHAHTLTVLLDRTGKQFSSEDFAAYIARRRDAGIRQMLFAIGPADGWSPAALDAARASGGLILSLGPMTLPHALARALLAEQIYRAFTILAGHPYHCGH